MNKQRRKAIDDLSTRLEEIMGDVEMIASEENEYAENMPENMQGSERHERAEEAGYMLDEAASEIQAILDHLNEAAE